MHMQMPLTEIGLPYSAVRHELSPFTPIWSSFYYSINSTSFLLIMRPTLLSLAVCIALAHAAPFPIDPDTPGSLQTWTYATPNRGPSRTHRTSKSAADPKRGRKKKPSSLASPVHADGQFDDPEEEPVKNVVKPQAQKSQPQESQPHEAPPAQWTESDKERLDQSEPVTEVVKAEVQKPEVQKPQVQTSQPQKAPPSKWAEGDEEKLSELKEDYQLQYVESRSWRFGGPANRIPSVFWA